jgi:hypothetical protein
VFCDDGVKDGEQIGRYGETERLTVLGLIAGSISPLAQGPYRVERVAADRPIK